ncbi:MAG TPA: SpoIIE family protein phosphatase [Terriglobales bacterium]|nr:SpoIIE family protein phosphatase [Terriglobales bacterium]
MSFPSPLRLARRVFGGRRPARRLLSDPLHSSVPALRGAEIAAIYHGCRVAGDFYEFLRVGVGRALFGLFDIAGRREDTRAILVAAQHTFRTAGAKLFAHADVNEPVAMIDLSQQLNRTILRAAGVRSCPAFIGCYNETLGTVCYANAGHTPALVTDRTGITQLEATGLPLGLFSHTTRSASTCALALGSVLLVVSRGIVDAARDGEEFGLGGVELSLRSVVAAAARDVCLTILHDVQRFIPDIAAENDLTALALVRTGDTQAPPE